MDTYSTSVSLRATRLRFASCILAGVLTACGGGGGPEVEPPLSGSVYPAVEGLVMIEYDDSGKELQRSTPTDAVGTFAFGNPKRGKRIESMTTQPLLDRTAFRSMQLAGASQPLLVTPVTTLTDQFSEAGLVSDQAERRVQALIQESCYSAMAAADVSDAAGSRKQEAMLWGVGAYIDALQNFGLTPATGRAWWLDKVQQHRTVLGNTCSMAAAAMSLPLEADVAKLAASSGGGGGVHLDVPLAQIRIRVMTDLLTLLGKSIAVTEYPQLASPELLGPGWTGSAAAEAVGLIKANVSRFLASHAVTTQSGVPRTLASVTLDRKGQAEQYIQGQISATDAVASAWVVNSTTELRAMRLSVNGTRLGGLGSTLEDLLRVPMAEPDEPLHRRAWRYVSLRHRHDNVITGGRMLHDPLLYLRSAGVGLCDDAASVLHFLWKSLGYRSRVLGLEGHVVPEVFVDDRWELYDPDLKHYFVLPTGKVANAEDISHRPMLLIEGARVVDPAYTMSYPDLLMGIYASQADNKEEPWYETSATGVMQPDIWLPPGGHLVIERDSAISIEAAYADATVPFASLKIWIPPGFSGPLNLGYLLTDVVGHGRISSPIREEMSITPAGIGAEVKFWFGTAPDLPVDKIVVHEVGPGGLTLVLAVNPYFFQSTQGLSFRIHSAALDGLALRAASLVN